MGAIFSLRKEKSCPVSLILGQTAVWAVQVFKVTVRFSLNTVSYPHVSKALLFFIGTTKSEPEMA